jgi:hypothetical protein
MKPITFPKLTLPDFGSNVAPTLGHRLVDDYLESVHARLRPNSTLAVVYDLKVFFTVIDVDPLEARRGFDSKTSGGVNADCSSPMARADSGLVRGTWRNHAGTAHRARPRRPHRRRRRSRLRSAPRDRT